MQRSWSERPRIAAGMLLATLLLTGGQALAMPSLEYERTRLQTSLYTTHFSPRDDHNNQQDLIGVEVHDSARWFAGTAWFKNSFDQPTWYFYAGREFPFWQPSDTLEVRGKLTGGLIRGYKGEFRDKIPFNRYGIAPALLPSVGVRWERLDADLIVFGTAGAMVTLGVSF
ncbi:hypothetical protein [Halomonas sp. 328]|uniref:hypothetical protein n=1 Tax=Halomonas sp. 328 TaxID=2776704 RepID=UPI0018A7B689|nr:hypothetical protein [Halomonas sp. 328]MBF8222899.1 hypothetical protein [Halomonas sp. 328]